ncbi:MAG: glycosyltransferase [Cyanobacteria bacterium J06607_15]
MTNLVSVIIPCFNAEQWLDEAIDSVLAQTYAPIEVIVIDDGSSDRSLSIIQSYGDQLIWRTQENQGANAARNLGFAIASGTYIQYLDADDYLLPDKIAQQVEHLQSNKADFVYGDWRYQHHLADGKVYLDEIRVCGDKADFLESLLANDRWSNLAPMLFTRSLVEQVSWDESLAAAQDRDFLFSVMLAGAKSIYLPGCNSVYRLHPGETVSTKSKTRWLEAHCRVMAKAEQNLREGGLMSPKYQQALATAYWSMGREYIYSNRDRHYPTYAKTLDRIHRLAPDLFLQNKSRLYQAVYQLLGYQATEKLSYLVHSQTAKINWGRS